jgi:2-hydroxychromene-2-carboxylate isomerase
MTETHSESDTLSISERFRLPPSGSLKASLKASVRKAMPFVSAHQTSTRRTQSKRERFEAQRAKKGEAHVVTYFHDVTDPRSHLTAQILTRLTRTYEIDLRIMLVSPPSDDIVVARELYETWAIKDTGDIAPWYLLEFEPGARRPDATAFDMASRLLSAAIARSTFLEDAPLIGAALWKDGSAGLNALSGDLPMADASLNARHLAEGDKLREKHGHFAGALFVYGEECYPGIERLYHLEERLIDLGVRNAWSAPKIMMPRRVESTQSLFEKTTDIKVEFFVSLQNPYAYIAMERSFRLARHYGFDLELRPVLPADEEVKTVPRAKRTYTTFDAKREAEAAGIDYGRVAKPDGEPIERLYSLYPWARNRQLGNDLLLSFAKGVFAEGIDAATDEGLKIIVERAGLSWDEALDHLGNDDWRLELEGNRVDLFQAGQWDTPTFRIEGGKVKGVFITRGQDRLWLVEEDLRRRMGVRQGIGLMTA